MTDQPKDGLEPESTVPEHEAAPKAKKPRAKNAAVKSAAKKSKPAKVEEAIAEEAAAAPAEPEPPFEPEAAVPEPEAAPKAKKPRAKKAEAKPKTKKEKPAKVEDPIGDVSDGEAATAAEPQSPSEPETEAPGEADADSDFTPAPRPPAKLERLQKILAASGVASRRKAEEMIEQGRVQVNGKIVTILGTKADAGRDHIRVDGKLLQGAERLRSFILNKPRGFVTTVKDPEGRPTVMQFFDKMHERLYPVGRLDYMSEGLLVVTNDGELANKLTKAASGVEKTYLVKVAGQPTEAELDILRGGVAIERGKPGSTKVRTSPARIRQVRQGDNPWYEVVLIEGRNRELRKMFEEVGHFVEKIRRVGYGPLVLDQEPGNMREMQPEELTALRLVADGKARTPKSKDLRRRNALDAAHLPTVAPRATQHPRPAKSFTPRPSEPGAAESSPGSVRPGEFRPKKPFGAKPFSPVRPARPGAAPASFGAARPPAPSADRPAWKKDDRPATNKPYGARPPAAKPYGDRPAAPRTFGARPPAGKPYGDRPAKPYGAKPPAGKAYGDRPAAARPYTDKPAWKKPERTDRPPFKRPPAPRREAQFQDDDLGPVRPPNLFIEEVQPSQRPDTGRSDSFRTRADRFPSGRAGDSRPDTGRSSAGRPQPREGLPRPFTTSSGKPRAGGPRPSSKPGNFSKSAYKDKGKPAARAFNPASGSGERSSSPRPSGPRSPGPRTIDPRTGSGYRPAPGGKRSYGPPSTGSGPQRDSPRGERSDRPRAERGSATGWKPKTRYGGSGKPASAGHSKPGGFSKSGGPKRTGPRPGGKRPSGPPSGKRRG
jgi:23S rRNA pseudouridine2605 synthase